MSKYPTGPKGLPVLGNLSFLRGDRLKFVTENRDRYGDIVHFRLGTRHIYQLNNPEHIQFMLAKYPDKFHKSPALKRATKDIIGQGLLTSEDELHKRQRRLVQPAFHFKRISSYADVMVDYTRQMIADWQPAQQYDIAHEMMRLTMRIVAKTLFDTDVTAHADTLGSAISVGIEATAQRVMQPFGLADYLPTEANRRRREAARTLDEAITAIINERRAIQEDKGDLLSMLLMATDEETGDPMSDRQVHNEAMTLFIAGHETTANALSWTFYLLAQHPQVEQKLVAELQPYTTTPLTLPQLAQLPYLEMVIKESMRLYPPAWATTRIALEDFELGGYHIPKGSFLMTSMYAVHRDKRYWDEPDAFRPERFSPENEANIPKYAYFPFGGGPRVCVGNQFAMMEAQLILGTILQQYSLRLATNQPITPQPLVTLRPLYGLPMTLQPRTVPPA